MSPLHRLHPGDLAKEAPKAPGPLQLRHQPAVEEVEELAELDEPHKERHRTGHEPLSDQTHRQEQDNEGELLD